MNRKSVVKLEEISFIRNGRKILDGINLKILEKENWVFLGTNGSGKTTLVNIIYGYLWASSGSVYLFNQKYGEIVLPNIQKQIGILQSSHQESMLQKRLTVVDVLGTGIFSTIGYYRSLTPEDETKIEKILSFNNWIKDKQQMYSTLSSGEKKKLLLLRALINEPKLLILDEPCSSLDIAAREDFFLLLRDYQKKLNFLTILITHRTEEIPKNFSHIMMLKDGSVLTSGKIEEKLNSENLKNLYDLHVNLTKINDRYYCCV